MVGYEAKDKIINTDLSIKAKNYCHSIDIETIDQLIQFSAEDLFKMPHWGKSLLLEIVLFLNKHDLQLNHNNQ